MSNTLHKYVVLLIVVLPFAGLVASMVIFWQRGFDFVQMGVLGVMWFLTGFGVTIGFHRYFSHRSFRTSRIVSGVLGICGSMASEGPLITWVACHRCHHHHSDDEKDPHSPHAHAHGGGVLGSMLGFWHAHVGWMFVRPPGRVYRYVSDLRADRQIRTINSLFLLWMFLGLALPTLAAGLLTWSWWGALMGLLWGGLARMFLVHHITWSINSVCHIWGQKTYRLGDESRNNVVMGVLAMGEGWHNNHHAFPTSARHGLRWWQIDVSYGIIRLMKAAGLVWDVKVPSRERQEAKLARLLKAGQAEAPAA